MTTDPLRCVIDASVGIKLFVNEPGSNEAHELFRHLTANPSAQFYVPDLFYIECASILWKYVRRFGLPPHEAKESIEELAVLNLRRVPTFDLMFDALDLTINHTMTSYDACYVALAHRLQIPLITADEKLVLALTKTTYVTFTLATFPIPPLPAID